MSAYVEITAGGGGGEFGSVTVNEDGSATIRVGTSAHGQGHATSFAMIVADRLGIPLDQIHFVAVRHRRGAPRWRHGRVAVAAARRFRRGRRGRRRARAAREVAATMLEANPDDIVVMDGGVGVAGVPSQRAHAGRGSREQEPISCGLRLRPGRARPSRSARTWPWSRSTSRPGGSPRSATSRSTTAAASSTRCSWPASSTAASRRASRRPCGSSSSTTTTATRSRRRSPTTRCRARRNSRRSRRRTPRRRRRATRSAPRASASRGRSGRRRRCRTP